MLILTSTTDLHSLRESHEGGVAFTWEECYSLQTAYICARDYWAGLLAKDGSDTDHLAQDQVNHYQKLHDQITKVLEAAS